MTTWTERSEPTTTYTERTETSKWEYGYWLLNEDGSYVLNEDGSKVVLEEAPYIWDNPDDESTDWTNPGNVTTDWGVRINAGITWEDADFTWASVSSTYGDITQITWTTRTKP